MEAWSTPSKVGLAIAFCAMFAVVLMLAGRDTQAQPPPPNLPGGVRSVAAPGVSPPAREGLSRQRTREDSPVSETDEPPADAPPPEADLAVVTDLSGQVMPLEESTAEENEQRGDAIRQLGSSTNPQAVPALVYALRNDVDIRNRILAIDGLRRAALAGNSDRAITDVLLEGSRSGDEVIASQAGQALAEIERARPLH